MARDEKVIIKIDKDIKDKFQKMAESYGMTMSALGAFAIGKMVKEEELKLQVNDRAIEMMIQTSLQKGESFFDENMIARMLEPVIKEVKHASSE